MAVDCGVVVFNVDYRLAPETRLASGYMWRLVITCWYSRCPNNVLDFYEAVKYVTKNAEDLGIDPARIAIAGESGGGTLCAAAMVHLARMEESHLVKLAIPVIPMLTDYSFTDPAAMTKEEAEGAAGQQKIWKLIAGPKVSNKRVFIILKTYVMLWRWSPWRTMLSYTQGKQTKRCWQKCHRLLFGRRSLISTSQMPQGLQAVSVQLGVFWSLWLFLEPSMGQVCPPDLLCLSWRGRHGGLLFRNIYWSNRKQ